jgi:putative resolvase
MRYKRLSEYAKDIGVAYVTAYRHFKKGLIPNSKQIETGTILVGYEDPLIEQASNRAIVYSRVSSNAMKNNLERQQRRLEDYAISRGYSIVLSVKEISSGMNDSRPKLQKILNSKDFDILVVEHKDRLTRFGFNYIETLLNKDNKKIEVVNISKNDNENLMEDLISIIYSFSARMYGQRKSRRKTEKLIQELKKIN